MNKIKYSKVLNIFSICIYLLATVLTSYLLIKYLAGDKTEGSGIYIMVLIFVNTIECFIVFLLNVIGLIILYHDKQVLKPKKQIGWMIGIMLLSALTFVAQLMTVS
ncbi:MAG: hypothetical protein PHX62_00515 [Bacilli bacterium]|nr:hypothetical protein [Bacilli bacterium]